MHQSERTDKITDKNLLMNTLCSNVKFIIYPQIINFGQSPLTIPKVFNSTKISSTDIMQRTALFEKHKAMNGKLVDFHGWEMPLHYELGIIKEHLAVRTSVGIFDVSHMGDFIIIDKSTNTTSKSTDIVEKPVDIVDKSTNTVNGSVDMGGKSSDKTFQSLLTNDITNVEPGKCVYTHMPDQEAKIIDDLIVTKLGHGKYLCVPNASMIDIDGTWMKENADIDLIDLSDDLTCLAVQGPNARKLLTEIFGQGIENIGKFEAEAFDFLSNKFVDLDRMNEKDMKNNIGIISGTGYTGEDGCEVIIPNKFAEKVWDALFNADVDFDVFPIGLGARDTLRLEAGFLLSGTDFNRDRTTMETNCVWVIKWNHDFIGKEILAKMKEEKKHQKLLGILLEGRAPARTGSVVRLADSPDEIMGWVSSGNYSPSLKKGIALAYLDRPHIKAGIPVLLDYHGRQVKGVTVKTPFLKK